MASGPLPPGGAQTGMKLFVYGVGKAAASGSIAGSQDPGAEINFLAQMVLVNETGAVSVTVKTDSAGAAGVGPGAGVPASEAANQFVGLVIAALSSFIL